MRDFDTKHRFGAVGRTGSIAIIERLWRTLKDVLELRTAAVALRLDERLGLGLFYYATLRPHQGLGGVTPTEMCFGLETAGAGAMPPPRAGPMAAGVAANSRSKWFISIPSSGFR